MSVLALYLAIACSGGTSAMTGPEGGDGDGSVSASTVTMTPSDLAVGVDGQASLSLEIRTEDGEPLDRDGEWTVEDPSVIEIQGDGPQRQVTGLAEGLTHVIGTVDGVADTADVEVAAHAPTVSSIELSPSDVTVEVGAAAEVSVTVTSSDGTTLDREGTWEIADTTVAGLGGVGTTRQVEGLSTGSTRVVATVDGVADTAAVDVTASETTVGSVELSPSDVTLEEGSTADLSLAVTASDGTSLDRDGTWEVEDTSVVGLSGTGATRQVEGLVTGSTMVIATVEGVADTAAVDVIGATDPADVEPVFEDGFDGGTLASTQNGYEWRGGWKYDVSSGAGRGGSGGLVLTYPGQSDGSDSKPQMNLDFGENVEEVWVGYWMKIPSNFLHRDQDSGSTNNKFFGVWRDNRVEPKVRLEFQRVKPVQDGDREESWIRAADTNSPLISEFGGTFQDADETPFIAKADHGQWIRVRWHMKVGNTNGSGGGILELWKNDVLFHSDSDVEKQFHENPAMNHFNAIRFLGWSNSGFDEDTPFVFDDVRVYTSNPGW